MNSIIKSASIAFAIVISLVVFTACENSSGDGDNSAIFGDSKQESEVKSTESALTGTWYLVAADGSSWYIHFANDGTWKITNDSAGAERRVYGSYTISGNTYSGDMTNPNVGVGTISGNILSASTIDLDFCEHWHTPYKHVAYSGTKQ